MIMLIQILFRILNNTYIQGYPDVQGYVILLIFLILPLVYVAEVFRNVPKSDAKLKLI